MDILTSLSKLLLPAEVFDYFTITSVSDHGDEVELFLEEKDVIHKPEKGHEYERNGFYETMTVQDYPIRGKRKIRLRSWRTSPSASPCCAESALTRRRTFLYSSNRTRVSASLCFSSVSMISQMPRRSGYSKCKFILM